MKTINNLILGVFSIGAIAIASVSCEREHITAGRNTGSIALNVTSESSLATKAMDLVDDAVLVEDLSTEDSPLFLTLATEKNTGSVFEAAKTKGEVVTNDNLKDRRSSFDMHIFNEGKPYANTAGKTDLTVAWDGKRWEFTEEVDWTDEGKDLEFYAHSDAYDSHKIEGQGFFKYNGWRSQGHGKDAESTYDFLVAHTEANENDVDIHFYHALTALRFYSDSLIITKVAIRNVNYAGEFTYKSDAGDDVDAIFSWSPYADSTTTYVQTYTETPDVRSGKESETFFLIPQDLNGDDVIITFYFKDDANGREKNISTKLLGTNRWKAGYIYNYTLTKSKSKVEPSVALVVNDEMNEDRTVKSNVAVENLKSNAAYVRAHVIANWYNTAHKAVAPWIESQGGTLKMNDGSDWVKGADGFYYCLQPVLGYSQTVYFIETASIDGANPPKSVYDLRLEMKIIAQGVEYDDQQVAFKATWPDAGEDVINNLKTL